nr:beta-microseminoprotein [Meriones unguiculatus]
MTFSCQTGQGGPAPGTRAPGPPRTRPGSAEESQLRKALLQPVMRLRVQPSYTQPHSQPPPPASPAQWALLAAVLISLKWGQTWFPLCDSGICIVLECVDADGEKHPVDSSWVKNCNECFCEEKSVHCCSQIRIPVSYDKQKCREEFHKESCTYNVVERDNPVKACPVEGWII